jgi:hypothetical protein
MGFALYPPRLKMPMEDVCTRRLKRVVTTLGSQDVEEAASLLGRHSRPG